MNTAPLPICCLSVCYLVWDDNIGHTESWKETIVCSITGTYASNHRLVYMHCISWAALCIHDSRFISCFLLLLHEFFFRKQHLLINNSFCDILKHLWGWKKWCWIFVNAVESDRFSNNCSLLLKMCCLHVPCKSDGKA